MEATVNIKGIEFEVSFDYQPEEKPERHYPGCHEEISINGITYKGDDFSDFVHIKEIEDAVWEAIENDRL